VYSLVCIIKIQHGNLLCHRSQLGLLFPFPGRFSVQMCKFDSEDNTTAL
jgi:hypothetical protein